MGQILSIKRWNPVEYRLSDQVVATMDLRRMNALEAAPFLRALTTARQAFTAIFPDGDIQPIPDDLSGEKLEERLAELRVQIARNQVGRAAYLQALPDELIRGLFTTAIRNVKVYVRVDDEDVTTSAGLLEIADTEMLMFVVNHLELYATLRSAEGKASGSPSTSGSGPEPTSGAPAAPSTESAASQVASTATLTPAPSPSTDPSAWGPTESRA